MRSSLLLARVVLTALLLLPTFPTFGASTRGTLGDTEGSLDFDLPAQSASAALLAVSKLTRVEVLFSFDALRDVRSNALKGRFTPAAALKQVLRGTGFVARPNGRDRFVVAADGQPAGGIKGVILNPDGSGAAGVRVVVHGTRLARTTTLDGSFDFPGVPTGNHRLVGHADGFQSVQFPAITVVADVTTVLPPHTLQPERDPARLAPYVVKDRTTRQDPFDRSEAQAGPRTAGGNLDLARTENDALPFTIYNRDQIARAGVVNLNEFLQRELIDSDASVRPPEQDGVADTFTAGSTNLNLRGFGADQTIVLVNGRRLPEALTSHSGTGPPDVNFIPLSLVQQVEVLPVSAASLYSGNAVGGIINIVLRPGVDAESTEVALTYTNAIASYDAPQTSASVLHARSLLGGALRVRINASFTRAIPPTESELRFRQTRPDPILSPYESLYRATPNIRSVVRGVDDQEKPPPLPPLFGPGSSPLTSIPPGADGTGGLSMFQGREGRRNFGLFETRGGMASSPDSIDYPYGREQKRSAYFGSLAYDVAPWLQLSFDGTYTQTVVNRGYDLMAMDLLLAENHPLNPFGQEVLVSLTEYAPLLGERHNEARLEFGSGVASALFMLPGGWRLLLDGQYGRNIAKFRGLGGYSFTRWQELVDRGIYNPLRDTQVFDPPQEFYDEVLIHRGGPGRFVTLGDYSTIDAAIRLTHHALDGPTGSTVFNAGADYRRNELAKYTDERRFADGALADEPVRYSGRTLERYSFFSEAQAPLLPSGWLPSWLRRLDSDVAVRYIAANQSRETNFAPTFALKAVLPAGFSLRGSVSTSSRFPTPVMSRRAQAPSGGGSGVVGEKKEIYDPRKDAARYNVIQDEILNPDLEPEGAVTQTAGVVFRRGREHRFRASIDFVDTHKVNEIVNLEAQDILNLEHLFPDRVIRSPAAPGEDTNGTGSVTSVLTGAINSEWRRSHNWNVTGDYAWTRCWGGTLDFYSRFLFFSRYQRLLLPGADVVDEINAPERGSGGILKYRAKFGAGWSNDRFGFGLDGHYFHSRIIPQLDRASQGSDRVRPYWQFDAFVQGEIGRWMPWLHQGLRMQVRVNNVFAQEFPRYEHSPSGAGVQPYGDWRGRVYSLSLTATF